MEDKKIQRLQSYIDKQVAGGKNRQDVINNITGTIKNNYTPEQQQKILGRLQNFQNNQTNNNQVQNNTNPTEQKINQQYDQAVQTITGNNNYNNLNNNYNNNTQIKAPKPAQNLSQNNNVQRNNVSNVQTSTQQQNNTQNTKPLQNGIRFGYETSAVERNQRNQYIAEQYVNNNMEYDEQKMSQQLHMLSSNKDPEAIQNTVEDIKNRINFLKRNRKITTKAQDFASLSIPELYQKYQNGDLGENSDVYKYLLNTNPNLISNLKGYIDKQNKLNNINQIAHRMQDSSNRITYDRDKSLDSQSSVIPQNNGIMQIDPFSAKMLEVFTNIVGQTQSNVPNWEKIYKDKIGTPEMLAQRHKLNDLVREIKDIDTKIASTEDEIRAKYIGMGVTEGRIQVRINKDIRALQKKRQLLTNKYEALANDYQNGIANAQEEMKRTVKTYEDGQKKTKENLEKFSIISGIYKDSKAYQLAQQQRQDRRNMLYLQEDFKRQAEKRTWNRQMEQLQIKMGDIDSGNPLAVKQGVTQMVSGIVDNFKPLGINFQRSIPQMTSDVINGLRGQGKNVTSSNVSEYIQNNLMENIKSKPEYQKWLKQNNPMSLADYTNINIQDAMGNKKSVFINKYTREVYDPNNPYQATNPKQKKAMEAVTGEYGGQCGAFANALTGIKSTPGGNNLQARKKAFADSIPEIGGQVLLTALPGENPNNTYNTKYGHIGVVWSVNGDGTMTIKQSNGDRNNPETVSFRTIKMNDPHIHGFYNKTPLAQGSGILFNGGGEQTDQYSIQNIIAKQNADRKDAELAFKKEQYYNQFKQTQQTNTKQTQGPSGGEPFQDDYSYYNPAFDYLYKTVQSGKVTKDILAQIKETHGNSENFGKAFNAFNMKQRVEGGVGELEKSLGYVNDLLKEGYSPLNARNRAQLLTKQGDIGYKLNYLGSNDVLKRLINAKNEGATFGALSDAEGELLRAASDLGGLNITLSEDHIKRVLNTYKQKVNLVLYEYKQTPFYDEYQKNKQKSSDVATNGTNVVNIFNSLSK